VVAGREGVTLPAPRYLIPQEGQFKQEVGTVSNYPTTTRKLGQERAVSDVEPNPGTGGASVPPQRQRPPRAVIAATCRTHTGPLGFTNLVVRVERGKVVFEPHAVPACGFDLTEDEASILRDWLTEVLG